MCACCAPCRTPAPTTATVAAAATAAAAAAAARGKDANPLAHVLQAIGEPLECVQYNTWNVLVPEGQFLTRVRKRAGSASTAVNLLHYVALH